MDSSLLFKAADILNNRTIRGLIRYWCQTCGVQTERKEIYKFQTQEYVRQEICECGIREY